MRRAISPVRARIWLIAVALAVTSLALTKSALAQTIKQPGAHPKYSLELDPHLVLQHDHTPFYADDGVGLGLRVSIPFLENGPIPQINNSMAMSFGGDFVIFDDDGSCRNDSNNELGDDCSATDLWLPVTVQWNFWFTRVVSAFFEPGLAISYWHRSWDVPCANGFCERSESELDPVNFVVFLGGRFLFGERAGMTVRIGWPYISVGGSFLL